MFHVSKSAHHCQGFQTSVSDLLGMIDDKSDFVQQYPEHLPQFQRVSFQLSPGDRGNRLVGTGGKTGHQSRHLNLPLILSTLACKKRSFFEDRRVSD